jgi:lipopolysaccharide/colanic/teichoic acid biosynthesis glycosyltransferase
METSFENLESEGEIAPLLYRNTFYKRVLDVSIIILAHIALLPVWIIIWIIIPVAIWLEDRGPVLFTDERVGQYGRRFKAYKFRSMVVNADDGVGPKQAEENDRRITKVGRILRATALDELPQLINILKGDMSFVGPRVLRGDEIEIHGTCRRIEGVPGYWDRAQVLPGLTGIAQIYASRDLTRKNKFRYDALYIKNMNAWLDIKLIFLSIWITLMRKWESRSDKVCLNLRKRWFNKSEAERGQSVANGKPIGQILLDANVITEAQLQEALEAQKGQGDKIGENLVRKRYVSEFTLNYFLNKQLIMNGGR